MAAQFDTARVTYQPQGQEGVQDLSSVFMRQGAEMQAYGGQQLQKASAYFDKALEQYNEFAVEKAQKDAPGIINRDGDGVLIPPSSFYPELGWKTLLGPAYAKTYQKASEAIYQQSAAADHETYSQAMKAKYPTDPAGYSAAMEERRLKVVGNLAPDQAGYIDLRLKQIQSTGATQVGVNLTASTNKVMLERADTEHAAIVDEALRLIPEIHKNLPADALAMPSEQQIKAMSEATLNTGMLKERWAGLEAQWRAAGISAPQIQRFREELGFSVLMKQQAEEIRNKTYKFDSDGRIDRGEEAADRERIRQIAKSYPGRELQVETTLNKALDYRVNQSALLASSQQLQQTRASEPIAKDLYRRGLEAYNSKDPVEQQRLYEGLAADSLKILNDSRFSDSVAMRLSGNAYQAGGMAKGALQESYSQRLTGLGGIISDTRSQQLGGPSPDAKERAYAEVLTINTDPNITQHMTTGQRSYAQGLINQVATTKLGADHAGLLAQAQAGVTDPQTFSAMVQRNVASGMYGNHVGAVANMATVDSMMATHKLAWDKNMATERLAADGLANSAAGRPITEAQKTAMATRVPFTLPGDKSLPDWSNPGAPQSVPTRTFNPTSPGHTDAVVAHHQRTSTVDAAVKDVTQNMPRSPDPQAMAPWADLYGQLYQSVVQKHRKATGQLLPDNEVRTELGTLLGASTGTYLKNVQLYGAEAAYKMDLGNADKTSVTGAQGQPTGASLNAMDAAASTFTQNIVKAGTSSTWLGRLTDWRLPFTDAAKLTDKERVAERFFTTSPDVKPGIVGTVLAQSPQFTGGLTIAPEVKDLIGGAANAYLATDGHAIKAQVKGETMQDYAFRQMMSENAGMLEIVASPDGNTGEIRFKSYAKAMGEKMGMDKLSEGAAQGTMHAMVQADREINNKIGPDYDPKTLVALPIVVPGRPPSWVITAAEKNTGLPLNLMTLGQNDPRLSAEAMALQRSSMLAVATHFRADDGKPPAPGAVDAYATSFSSIVALPMEKWLRDHHVSAATMNPENHRAFKDEFDKRLRQLNVVAGQENAPDWEKTLAGMAKDNTFSPGLGGLNAMAQAYHRSQSPEPRLVPR